MGVRAMKAGAIDFLTKPFRSQDILDAVFAALERDDARRRMLQRHSAILGYYQSLSRREREVIRSVASGALLFLNQLGDLIARVYDTELSQYSTVSKFPIFQDVPPDQARKLRLEDWTSNNAMDPKTE